MSNEISRRQFSKLSLLGAAAVGVGSTPAQSLDKPDPESCADPVVCDRDRLEHNFRINNLTAGDIEDHFAMGTSLCSLAGLSVIDAGELENALKEQLHEYDYIDPIFPQFVMDGDAEVAIPKPKSLVLGYDLFSGLQSELVSQMFGKYSNYRVNHVGEWTYDFSMGNELVGLSPNSYDPRLSRWFVHAKNPRTGKHPTCCEDMTCDRRMTFVTTATGEMRKQQYELLLDMGRNHYGWNGVIDASDMLSKQDRENHKGYAVLGYLDRTFKIIVECPTGFGWGSALRASSFIYEPWYTCRIGFSTNPEHYGLGPKDWDTDGYAERPNNA